MQAVLTVLLDPILPVFAIAAIGYVAGRSGFVALDQARMLNRVVMAIFLPLLLLDITINAPIDAFALDAVLVYFGAELTTLALGFAVARFVFGLGRPESFLLGFAASFTNTVIYVFPLTKLIYGEDAILPVISVVTLDSTITFAFAVIMIQLLDPARGAAAATARSLARNPIIAAIVLGLLVNLTDVPVPPSVATFVAFNGVAMPPLALFALGVVMSSIRFRPDAAVLTCAAINMLVFPLIVLAGLRLLAPAAPGADLYVFVAAGPAGAMAFNLALLHDVRPDRIGQLILGTSVATLVTLALLA